MKDSRVFKAKLNIVVSLTSQLVTLLCGLIVPQLMIRTFGSETYGAITSITQFLGYIALIEGGIGGVARAALYKPLADGNIDAISDVVFEIKGFFRRIGYVFIVYTLILACLFKYIGKVSEMDWIFTFTLVIVISISTLAQYFIGISYSILLQAAQKTYVVHAISIFTTVVNTIIIVILINFDCNVIIVKLVSSLIFVLRPIALWLYVRNRFKLNTSKTKDEIVLKDKWVGLGQHLAYFLYSHTDVMVLTVFGNLSMVAVYSVYHMITSHIQTLASSFTTGMEAFFGDMLAKKEFEMFHKVFSYYETLISCLAVVLFGVTAVLIVPFIEIYTHGVSDANYVEPVFAVVLTVASLIYCLRTPYTKVVVAAGHFKQTSTAAYGEAIINIVLSIILIGKWGLVGVAIATVIATAFREVCYVLYLQKNIISRSIRLFLKRTLINFGCFILIYIFGNMIISCIEITNYIAWVIYAIPITILAIMLIVVVNYVFYRNDMYAIVSKIKPKRGKKDDKKH